MMELKCGTVSENVSISNKEFHPDQSDPGKSLCRAETFWEGNKGNG